MIIEIVFESKSDQNVLINKITPDSRYEIITFSSNGISGDEEFIVQFVINIASGIISGVVANHIYSLIKNCNSKKIRLNGSLVDKQVIKNIGKHDEEE